MTPSPSGSPLRVPEPLNDEAPFPRGHCRYILTVPGIKGQRCACVSFIHNKGLPGATCDCGHLSCFHLTGLEDQSPGDSKTELELLKERVQLLEEHTDWAGQGGLESIPQRVRQLEETIERSRDEVQADIKGAYRSVSGAWQLAERLQKRMASLEDVFRVHSEQLARAGKELQDLRNRQLELLDSDESLEERIEKLEGETTLALPLSVGKPAITEPARDTSPLTYASQAPKPANPCTSNSHLVLTASDQGSAVNEPEIIPPIAPAPSTSWTVHVSLLPSREQLYPFEKDNNAYKRCLSRGLHRMVAVGASDGPSFVSAVSRAFREALQDRPWEPLQVKARENSPRRGLPTLQPLDSSLVQKSYNAEFLRQHCAVCDEGGRIDSLYIALRSGQLSWPFLKQLPVHLEGLESSWVHDKHLDGTSGAEGDEPGALMLPPLSQSVSPASSLKRSASELSLSTHSTTSSATSQEYHSPRNKVARTCMTSMVEVPHSLRAAL